MDIQNLDEVVEKILEGNCLLFLGSGFSAGAYNNLDERMPIGGGLAKLLDEKTGVDNDGDLEESAECYIDMYGEVALAQLLRNTFTVKTPSDGQKAVCGCRWRRIYTTNYDNSVEQITAKDGKQYLPVTLSSDSQDYVNKREIVVHLNGSVFNLSAGTMSTEFKLTSGSYLTQLFLDSSWRNLFEYDIKDSDLIVFIGFSLKYDLDIKRILWEDGNTKKKCVFIMADCESQQNLKKASRFGVPFSIGLEVFGKKIVEAKRLNQLRSQN